MAGTKFDEEKPRLDLVTPEFIEGVAKVLTFGAKKYDAWNWAEGIDFSRVYGAAQRHLNEWKKGTNYDEETGLNHLYHAACCLMFLSSYQEWNMSELDDRYKKTEGLCPPSLPNYGLIKEEDIGYIKRIDVIGSNGNDGDHYDELVRGPDNK